MDQSTSREKNGPEGARGKRTVAIVLAVVVLLLLGLAGRQWLYRAYDPAKWDSSPAPRPEINAPFITSEEAVVDKMVQVARLTPDDLVYDLGCGDGRIVIAAVAASGCRGVGIDIDPERIAESNENARRRGVAEQIEFREQDVFTVDLQAADVAMIYLTGWMIAKLEKQFEQMKPGSRVVTHDFWIEHVRPDQVVQVQADNGEHNVYFYVLPLKRDQTMERGKPPQPQDAVAAPGDAEFH